MHRTTNNIKVTYNILHTYNRSDTTTAFTSSKTPTTPWSTSRPLHKRLRSPIRWRTEGRPAAAKAAQEAQPQVQQPDLHIRHEYVQPPANIEVQEQEVPKSPPNRNTNVIQEPVAQRPVPVKAFPMQRPEFQTATTSSSSTSQAQPLPVGPVNRGSNKMTEFTG